MSFGRTSLRPAEMRRAEELKILGMGWKEVGKSLNRSPDTLRRAIEPGYRERRIKQINAARLRQKKEPRLPRYVASIGNHWADAATREKVPAAVLADRDHRAELPRTLTAMLCGDPAPGYSALDRRH